LLRPVTSATTSEVSLGRLSVEQFGVYKSVIVVIIICSYDL
jgi:hypothetical protein